MDHLPAAFKIIEDIKPSTTANFRLLAIMVLRNHRESYLCERVRGARARQAVCGRRSRAGAFAASQQLVWFGRQSSSVGGACRTVVCSLTIVHVRQNSESKVVSISVRRDFEGIAAVDRGKFTGDTNQWRDRGDGKRGRVKSVINCHVVSHDIL